MTTLKIKAENLHEIVWQGRENKTVIIRHLFHNAIHRGKSLYWYWADFSATWYRYAQNAFNDVKNHHGNFITYRVANVIALNFENVPNFEIPSRDLQNEYSDLYYITMDSIGDGLHRFSILHPSEYIEFINCAFDYNSDLIMDSMQPTLHQRIHDFAFQYVVFGKQKYERVIS